METFVSLLKRFSGQFNDKLPQLFDFPQGSEQEVSRAMFYSLSNGGKRLRPFLVTETAKLFNIAENISFPVAASLEMLHTYSLIHDDLPAMDNDDLRRGKPTCHKQYNEATAILAGDGLLTYAFEILSNAKDISDSVKIKLISMLSQKSGAFCGMIAGQMLDIQTEKTPQMSSEEIIKHIEEMKTGCLISYACQAGALLGNASADEYQTISEYSRNIGIAFQISDDILDVEGDAKLMGKTLGKDSAQGKLTFVSLYGLNKAKELARRLTDEAKQKISLFGPKSTNLCMLADFIINRNH